MPLFRSADEVVVGDVQLGPDTLPLRRHPVDELSGGNPLLAGLAVDVERMLIGPGEEDGVVPTQPVIAGQDVSGHRRVVMTDMGTVVHVVDGCGDVVLGRRLAHCRGALLDAPSMTMVISPLAG